MDASFLVERSCLAVLLERVGGYERCLAFGNYNTSIKL